MRKTLDRKEKGAKTQPSSRSIKHASHSKWPPARPEVAPEPARPMKCSVEMFETKSDPPMANQPMLRLARKNTPEEGSFREKQKPMPNTMAKEIPLLPTPRGSRIHGVTSAENRTSAGSSWG